MTCIRCDRCGEIYEAGMGNFIMTYGGKGMGNNQKDLCPKCAEQFRKFMETKEEICRNTQDQK